MQLSRSVTARREDANEINQSTGSLSRGRMEDIYLQNENYYDQVEVNKSKRKTKK